MESWNRGRDEILKQVVEVYDRVGHNISAELDDERYVRISREELRLLRENATQVDKLSECNSRLQDDLEKCRSITSRVEELENENQRLAAELEDAMKQRRIEVVTTKKQGSGIITPGPSSEPTSSSSSRTGINPASKVSWEKYQDLVARFNIVSTNYKQIKEAKLRLEAKIELDKAKFRKWNKFREGQETKNGRQNERIQQQMEDIQMLQIHIKDLTGEVPPIIDRERYLSPGQDVDVPRSSPARAPSAHVEDYAALEDEPQLPEHQRDVRITVDDTQFADLEHQQFTGSDDHHPPLEFEQDRANQVVKLEAVEDPNSSPGSVIVLSSKSVKARKDVGVNTASKSVIKIEDNGSSPIGLAAILNMNDSIDLDEIGRKVDTPRKRKRAQELLRRVSNLASSPLSSRRASLVQNDCDDTEVMDPIRAPGIVIATTVLKPKNVNSPVIPRESDERAPKKHKFADFGAINSLLEDGEHLNSEISTTCLLPGAKQPLNALLATPSPKKQILNSTRFAVSGDQVVFTSPHAHTRPMEEVGQGQRAKNQYAAPCIPYSEIIKQGRRPQQPSKKPLGQLNDLLRPNVSEDFQASLESDQFSSTGNSQSVTNPSNLSSRDTSPFDGLPKMVKNTPRMIDFFKNTKDNVTPSRPPTGVSAQASTTKRRNHHVVDVDGKLDVNPEHEPLRLRPVQSLTLQDFKVNPKHNQGYDYAFSEVTRGKDARQCLQGCTRLECCGKKFRALVGGMRDPEKPLTLSQEEADMILLQKYMGGQAYKIQNMSKEELAEMVLQAKTQEYADKHGRHRHAFGRARSPPGFWRADMPTTQEEIEDRAKARVQQREAIEERHREAMKGGRYLFRDE